VNEHAQQLRAKAAGGTFCIVPYCHPDFSWVHHREWHEERYAVSTAEALDLMREHPEFRFCVEPWIDHVQPFLERCPDRLEELRERLNSGQMGVKAFTLTSPRPATCADETFLRNMSLGRKVYRAFAPQADLTVMACPDVGIGHSQMPQVVKLAGGRMYRGWRSDSAFSAKGVPRDFIWRGLDGTELITSRGIYGGLIYSELIPDDFAERWEEVVERLFAGELAQSMDCSSTRTWWVAQGMDDARPLRGWPLDRPLPLVDFVKAWNEREDSAMAFATPNEYRARLEIADCRLPIADCRGPDSGKSQFAIRNSQFGPGVRSLPVWEGVIDPVDVAYNSGWHGQWGLWRLRQQLDTAMVIAERACALAELAFGSAADSAAASSGGKRDFRTPEVGNRQEELWVEVVRVASHAQQWVFEKDWDWLLSRARYALREIREEGERAIARLAGVGRRSDARRPLVLFNPLPYPREEIIEVPWVQPRQDAGGHRVWDAGGQEVAVQLGEPAGETWGRVVESPLIFQAKVPALGCAVYQVGDGPVAERPPAPEGDVVDNDSLRLRLSGRGLQEITDRATGLTWPAPRGSCIGDCRLFEMGPGILHIGPITGEISGETGRGRWILTGPARHLYRWECEFHGHRVRQDVILDEACRHVDFHTRVFCAGANGFFALCFDLPIRGELHVDIPFGVEPRDLTHEPYAMTLPPSSGNIERHREHQFWARSWASVFGSPPYEGGAGGGNATQGLTLITADGDKYWTYDAATGKLRHILFTPLRDEDEGWEAWVTKERQALGWHEFRHRLLFHDGNWKDADVCGASDRLRLPLQAVKPVGPEVPKVPKVPKVTEGESDEQDHLLSVSPTSVRLSAFYRAAEGYVLRVYESSGEAVEATIRLPAEFRQALRTDFNLEPLDAPVGLQGNQLTLPLRAWEIATVLVSP
jgi:hypothetical protein